jgi:phage shock protein PspC (stress-responsive transcriptional regulator)
MTEQRTSDPQTGMDKFFDTLRGTRVRRRTSDTWFRGVCSGLADRLGVDPVIVRAALVLLTVLGGAGITIYLVAWALLPNDRNEIVAQRALRDGDGSSVVVIVFASLAVFGGFGGLWWTGHSGWGFPWGLALTGLLIWWLVQRSGNSPDADQRVMAQRPDTPYAAGPASTASPAGAATTAFTAAPATAPFAGGASPTTATQAVVRKPRRRSGGPLMALLAIGLTLVTYGSLIWAGAEYDWTGDHRAIALAGSLAALGLLLVVLGLAGWRAGFVAFLATVLAIAALSSAVVPKGIQLSGRVGDATWAPTSVAAASDYHLGVGDGVLNLSDLPTEGLSEAKIPASVGMGELKVIVPAGLTVKVVGHVGLGEILLTGEGLVDTSSKSGSDVSRSVVVGDGPTEVIVDAGVGIGQLTVVKE